VAEHGYDVCSIVCVVIESSVEFSSANVSVGEGRRMLYVFEQLRTSFAKTMTMMYDAVSARFDGS
jgi:hypothetical protein